MDQQRDDRLVLRPHQQALLVRIQGFIQQQLADPRLGPASIAAAHHISLRYLYRLFQHQQTTVGAFIRRQRLERCRRDLADAGLSHLPIHAVAAGWGFTEPAVFSRTFRGAYGMSPREYRHGAVTAGTCGTRPGRARTAS
jgi:AraC-like DNA-binding protein